MEIKKTYTLTFQWPGSGELPTDEYFDNVLIRHYCMDNWDFAGGDEDVDIHAYCADINNISDLKADIEAGTVWEPPEESLRGARAEFIISDDTLDAFYKEIDAYSDIGSTVRGAPDDHAAHLQAHMQMRAAAQQTYGTATNKTIAQQVATSHDWHHDGNNWACLVCGSKFDPMTPTCSGINAADWAVPVWETEPVAAARTWRHGYCVQCDCELSPAMDGEGATQCSKCNR